MRPALLSERSEATLQACDSLFRKKSSLLRRSLGKRGKIRAENRERGGLRTLYGRARLVEMCINPVRDLIVSRILARSLSWINIFG
jgi:hypothetical protein